MNPYVTTPDLARDDLGGREPEALAGPAAPTGRRARRWWALSGLVAGVLAPVGTLYVDAAGNPAYDRAMTGGVEAYPARLREIADAMTVFHVLVTVAALLLVVFAAGLHQRLQRGVPSGSALPGVAAAGLVVTAALLLLGTGLDTEVVFGARQGHLDAGLAGLYSHWIGTVPYLWTAAGLSGLAIAVAALRHRALPRWIGVTGLLLGGLTAVLGCSPLEYMAGMTGWLWLMVTGLGLLVGDRAADKTAARG